MAGNDGDAEPDGKAPDAGLRSLRVREHDERASTEEVGQFALGDVSPVVVDAFIGERQRGFAPSADMQLDLGTLLPHARHRTTQGLEALVGSEPTEEADCGLARRLQRWFAKLDPMGDRRAVLAFPKVELSAQALAVHDHEGRAPAPGFARRPHEPLLWTPMHRLTRVKDGIVDREHNRNPGNERKRAGIDALVHVEDVRSKALDSAADSSQCWNASWIALASAL